jgi:hypothetical protein
VLRGVQLLLVSQQKTLSLEGEGRVRVKPSLKDKDIKKQIKYHKGNPRGVKINFK